MLRKNIAEMQQNIPQKMEANHGNMHSLPMIVFHVHLVLNTFWLNHSTVFKIDNY